ncbi:hypothetical protein DW946_14605, partial [Bacteroides caccae]
WAFYPKTEHIAFISDNTYGGVTMQALVRKGKVVGKHIIRLLSTCASTCRLDFQPPSFLKKRNEDITDLLNYHQI